MHSWFFMCPPEYVIQHCVRRYQVGTHHCKTSFISDATQTEVLCLT